MRWLTKFYDFSFKWTATAGIGIHPTKPWLSQLVNFKNAIWTWGHFRRNSVLNLEKSPQKRMECFRLVFDHLAWIEHRFLSGIRDSRKAGSLWGMMTGVGGVRKSIDQSWLAKGVGLGLGLLCWSFKGVQKRFPRKRPALFKSGQWHFHQDNAPVHNSILVTDYLSKMGIKTFLTLPIVQTLLPVTFGYSLSSEAVVFMRQLRRWKRLWQRSLTRSHKRTSMGPFRSCWNGTISALQPEEITSKGTRVSCVYYQ